MRVCWQPSKIYMASSHNYREPRNSTNCSTSSIPSSSHQKYKVLKILSIFLYPCELINQACEIIWPVSWWGHTPLINLVVFAAMATLGSLFPRALTCFWFFSRHLDYGKRIMRPLLKLAAFNLLVALFL